MPFLVHGESAAGMKMRVLDRDVMYRGRLFRLVRSRVRFAGRAPVTRDCVEHPGAVAVVPIQPGNRVVLIRQYRFAVRGTLWEIPAGTLEPGESPRRCAGRELMEEIGYRAGRLERLGTFYTAPGFCSERIHLFLARDLRPERRPGDADEFIRPRTVSWTEAIRMAVSGRIHDAKTLAGLFLAAHHLGLAARGPADDRRDPRNSGGRRATPRNGTCREPQRA
jgi:ADP-ribose pyrophosphatase